MSAAHDIPRDTRERQRNASNPQQSVWVSANAGSGKTHVLVQRVLRLLLEGVPPAKILCLTFTKAAAANMSQRVFQALADWTRLDDSDLRRAIAETGAPLPGPSALLFARRLFARTVETPGGLKIQTIHAFCERLLHVFPFEANVPARFEVLEELHEAELLERARMDVLTSAAQDKGTLGGHLEQLVSEISGQGLEDIVKEAMRHAALFRETAPETHDARLRHRLGLAIEDSVSSVTQDMVEGGLHPSQWNELAVLCAQGSKNDQCRADVLQHAAEAWRSGDIDICLEIYLQFFFTKDGCGPPYVDVVTKTLAKKYPSLAQELNEEQQRLERLRDKRAAVTTLDRTRSLFALTRQIITRYEHMKAIRGLLDFNDLIGKTFALLTRGDARWVLYKLDRGIDHILVDEAQDTSEAQWRILEELMSDFAVGAAARLPRRTFFAVGDDKQSIFSFQGAAPHKFHEMRRGLAQKFKAGGETFAHVELTLSFRSVPAVLAAVDRIFDRAEHQSGVSHDVWMPHEALKRDLPGLIELWPSFGVDEREDAGDWTLPLDALDEQDPASKVAGRIAAKIAKLLAPGSGEYVHDTRTRLPRAVQAGDILILVRTRGPFFEAVIRALKQANVPVAGADRLDLTAHIAVMDLIAAGRAALLPQDDLTLAALLKSPLIGLTDEDLMQIAPRRTGSLFDALAQSSEESHKAAFAKISRWRLRAVREMPFAFYMRLLSEDRGRHDMEARLGPEAGDAIDEFLRLALLHEQEPAPSLSQFLAALADIDLTVKRDMESGTDAVRVMTVHAAKGLEAKIVFLPDTCGLPAAQHDPKLFNLENAGEETILAWSSRKSEDCAEVAAAREKSREAAAEEYRRLLYVALTRAEERLYIAGFYGARDPQPTCWYNMMKTALQDELEAVPAFWNTDETVLRRFTPGAGQLAMLLEPQHKPRVAAQLPDWLHEPAQHEASPRPPLRPSSALASADMIEPKLVSPAQRDAMRRGQFMHILLQYLPSVPAERRPMLGAAFLMARAPDMPDTARTALVQDALAVIDAPELASLFSAGSKAEVPIAGRVTRQGRPDIEVLGQVDRIAETDDEVLIADFKTGTPLEAEATPEAYLTQMALYRAALAPLWPQKQLGMLLIWTSGPKVVRLAQDQLDRALAALDTPS